MGWEELQQELTKLFTTEGVFGKKIQAIHQSEITYGKFVDATFIGHSILSISFQEFLVETVQAAASIWGQEDYRPTPPTYAETVRWYLGNFRNLRSIDIMFRNGYPLDGFARLRHLKESALFLGAMLSGLTALSKIRGWDAVENPEKKLARADMDEIRKKRWKEQQRILDLMVRKKSGFDDDQLSELKKWEDFFNEEVHGAILTQVFELGSQQPITVAPTPKRLPIAMFVNRFCEVCWMLHRTLPILQLSNRRFDDKWVHKWQLLDDNFKAMEQSLADTGKHIAAVFITFIGTKFPFSPGFCFDTHVKFP